jgi:hypothetical protein
MNANEARNATAAAKHQKVLDRAGNTLDIIKKAAKDGNSSVRLANPTPEQVDALNTLGYVINGSGTTYTVKW